MSDIKSSEFGVVDIWISARRIEERLCVYRDCLDDIQAHVQKEFKKKNTIKMSLMNRLLEYDVQWLMTENPFSVF